MYLATSSLSHYVTLNLFQGLHQMLKRVQHDVLMLGCGSFAVTLPYEEAFV